MVGSDIQTPPKSRYSAMSKGIKIPCAFLVFFLSFTPLSAHSQENNIESLERQFQEEPENIVILKKLGTAYLNSGRNQDASKILEKAKVINPEASDVRWKLALAYWGLKKDELSMEEARVSIQINPNQFQPHAILGDLLFYSKQDNAALKEYELAALLNPKHIIVYKNIGSIHHSSKRYKEAINAYNKYLQKFPKDANVQYQLGMAFWSLRKYKEAILSYKNTLEIDPSDEEARLWLGMTYSSISKYKEAIEEFEIYINSNNENSFAYQNYGNALFLNKEYEEALKKLRIALEINPNNFVSRVILSKVYGRLNKPSDQIKELKTVLKNNPKYLGIHNELADAYFDNKKYKLAIKEFNKHLETNKKDTRSIYFIARAYQNLNKIPDAIDTLKAGIETVPNYQSFYQELGLIYDKLGRYEDAITQLKKSTEIKEDSYSHGQMSYIYAYKLGKVKEALKEGLLAVESNPRDPWIYSHLAGLYQQIGNLETALHYREKYINLIEIKHGKNHQMYSTALLDMSYTYELMGALEKANDIYQRVLKTNKAILEQSPDRYLQTLFDMANRLASRGTKKYEDESFKLLEEAKTIGDFTPGIEVSMQARINSELGMAYVKNGTFDKGEPLLKNAYETQKQLGLLKDLPTTLRGLSLLYSNTRVIDKWMGVLRELIEINRKLYGENSVIYAHTLGELAAAQTAIGDLTSARTNAAKCLELTKTLSHTNSDTYLLCLHMAGSIALTQENFAEAEKYFEKTIQGNISPSFKNQAYVGHFALGIIHAKKNNFKLAEEQMRTATKKLDETFLSGLPIYAELTGNLAWVLLMQDKVEEAYLLAEKAAENYVNHVDKVFKYTSEEDKINFLRAADIDFYATVAMRKINEPRVRKRLYLRILQYKNNILDQLASQNEIRSISLDPTIKRIFQELTAKRKKLSGLKISLAKNLIEPGNYLKLKKEIDELERLFSLAYSENSISPGLSGLNMDRLLESIPKNSTLIEFVKVNPDKFDEKSKEDKYIAIVVNSKKEINVVVLGKAKEIDRALASLKRSVREVDDESTIKTKANKLYKSIFKPLEEYFSRSKSIFIAPDSNLNLLSFNILVDDAGKYLIEKYAISYVNSGKDFLNKLDKTNNTKKETFIFAGNPSFDPPENIMQIPITSSELFLAQVRSADSDGLHFKPLPETQVEVDEIGSLFKSDNNVVVLSGESASEHAIKNISSPKILHLATHGFFLEDQVSESRDIDNKSKNISLGIGFRGIGGRLSQMVDGSNLDNPLLRSGLAFSSANSPSENIKKTGEDGLLVALEISGLNLVGTDLVVLSACDTGIGEVPKGQGVVGMRRAFQEAGAKSIVMSLWQVPDRETKNLMIKFYKKLYDGKSKIESIHEASLEVMRSIKEKKGTTHPFYWGGFMLLGDSGVIN